MLIWPIRVLIPSTFLRRKLGGEAERIETHGALVFLAQVFVGAAAIWTHFPVSLRALHIGLATAVWGIMVAVALFSKPRENQDPLGLETERVSPGLESLTPGQEPT